jgi:hypothetical protein
MAMHPDSASMSAEVIEEYLTTIRRCLDYRKPGGGCLGYPSVLLLFCTVEALGNYLVKEGDPFQVLNHQPFGLDLQPYQIRKLIKWYRHLLAHAAMIAPGTYLTNEADGDPFEFVPNGEPLKIRVIPFYKIVKAAWDKFDKKLLKPESQLDEEHYRTVAGTLALSPPMQISASGSNYVPKPIHVRVPRRRT